LLKAFEGIVGHEATLRFLERALAGGVSHAYLFYGPPGVGKQTVACRFGASLVAGEDSEAEERALRGIHPDLVFLGPEGAFTTISQAREVIRLAATRPFEGARRVFVMRADTFNVQAANALLKTLESPEGETVFVLLATSRESVMPTVRSRSQALRFDPVPVPEVERFLSERLGDAAAMEPRLAAMLGRGSVGLSLRYAEGGAMRELRDAAFETAFALHEDYEGRHRAAARLVGRAEAVGSEREAAYLAAFEDPDRWAKEGAKRAGRAARDGAVREAMGLISLSYRDAAVVAAGAEELVVNTDRLPELRERVDVDPEADWAEAAIRVGEAAGALAYNVSPEATLEVALSRIRRKVLESSRGS
jgi:DNA polymerase-3 subunit delta'